MCGVLLIYVVVFGLNGLWHAKHREREMLYGSCQSPKVSKALQVLGLNQYLDDNKQVVWKSLPNQKMPLLIEKVRELFPYELKFKWFKKERHEIIVEDDEHFD
jgi:putative membrane protein